MRYGCGFRVVWDDINLQDLVEEAKADWYREQTRKLALENRKLEREAGLNGALPQESERNNIYGN